MSTILKALRRLEDDKLAQRPVSLEESVVTPAEAMRASRRSRLLVGGLGVVGALVLALGAMFVLRSSGPGDARAPRAESPAGFAVDVAPRRSAAALDAPQTHEQTQEKVNKAARGAGPGRSSTEHVAAMPSEPVARVGIAADETPRREIEAHREPGSAAAPPEDAARGEHRARVRDVEDLPLGSSGRAARSSANVAPPVSEPASQRVAAAVREPRVSVGPVETVVRTPKLALSVTQTVWHPSPSRRVAIVELEDGSTKRLREGDPIAGYTVGQIGLADVEFLRGGVSISKRVGR